jgi:hypothetical protein
MRNSQHFVSVLACSCFITSVASAQAPLVPAARNTVVPAARANIAPARELPPAESSHDPLPPAPSPVTGKTVKLVQQAGVGGPVAYARGGVLELGGAVSWSKVSDDNVLTVSPIFGWFVTDNVEISAIAQVSHSSDNNTSNTFFTGLIEPSLHVPVSNQAFVFGGMGVGAAYHKGSGTGVAIAPRVGVNVLVGRSGILTPSVTLNWSSNAAVQTERGTALAVNTTYGANIAYSVMW